MSKQQQQLPDPEAAPNPDLVIPIEGGWGVGIQFSMSTNKVEGEAPPGSENWGIFLLLPPELMKLN